MHAHTLRGRWPLRCCYDIRCRVHTFVNTTLHGTHLDACMLHDLFRIWNISIRVNLHIYTEHTSQASSYTYIVKKKNERIKKKILIFFINSINIKMFDIYIEIFRFKLLLNFYLKIHDCIVTYLQISISNHISEKVNWFIWGTHPFKTPFSVCILLHHNEPEMDLYI